jgi:hypothetical protein
MRVNDEIEIPCGNGDQELLLTAAACGATDWQLVLAAAK